MINSLVPITQTNTGMPAIRAAGLRNSLKPLDKVKRSSARRRAVMFTIDHTRFSEAVGKIQNCQHTWVKESKGDDNRYRGLGCGERKLCPTCGGYRQDALSQEATQDMLVAQSYFDIIGDELKSCGLKVILTIPKSESERIDALLWTDEQAWTEEIRKMKEKLCYPFMKHWFGKGAGGNESLHLTGEGDPCNPHYHYNFYVFPAVKQVKKYNILPRWYDVEAMRASWTDRVNNYFGLTLANADFKINYIEKPGQLGNWMRYLYRHSLDDLWKGLRELQGDGVEYVYGHGKRKVLALKDINRAYERIKKIPTHFKRINWWGIFSDGQRAKTMDSLWLEPEEVNNDNEPEWIVQGYYHFMSYQDTGIVLKDCLTNELVSVPGMLIDYRPKGVTLGKRKRWHEPGWNLARAGPVRTRVRTLKGAFDG